MPDFDTSDRDFIDAIWKKTRYLEYLRCQEENNAKEVHVLKKKKLKSFLAFSLGLILISVPIIVIKEFDQGFAALLSLYMLSFALYYEHKFS